MTDGEFREQLKSAVDKALTGAETRNIMMVAGGALEVQKLLTEFFDAEWASATFGRIVALWRWAGSDEGKAWFAPLFAMFQDES